jgi:H+-transporting ATPase
MEIAVLIAAGLRDWIDFGVIIGILMLNAAVGWYQEKQAADVVASLKGDIAMKAMCVRDGKETSILARELVPGDIVRDGRSSSPRATANPLLQIIIEEGQVIPADAHLICEYGNPNGFEEWQKSKHDVHADDSKEKKEGSEEDDEDDHHFGNPIVAADQSAITGESLAVDKYVGDTCYYTTGCKRGKAYAIVLTTAKTSFVGRTASLVQGAKDQGHFKAIMNSIGTALLVVVVAFIMAAWIGGFFRHLKISTPEDSSENLLHYVLILLIIGVPVGLPVVTTTTLAVGAAYLAKEKAIVQKLTAIESLAVSLLHAPRFP